MPCPTARPHGLWHALRAWNMRDVNAALRQEADRRAAELADARSRIEGLSAQVEVLTAKDRASGARADAADQKTVALERDLESLHSLAGLFKDRSGLTLAEARGVFLKDQEDEISRRLREKFEHDAPGLCEERLREVLRSGSWPREIADLIHAEAWKLTEATLRDVGRWPDWFKNLRDEDVKRRVLESLDKEFNQRVSFGVAMRFQALKAGEWNEYVNQRVARLPPSLRSMALELMGTYKFLCDICGGKVLFNVGPSELATLLKEGGAVRPMCPNPSCAGLAVRLAGSFGGLGLHQLPPVTFEVILSYFVQRGDLRS